VCLCLLANTALDWVIWVAYSGLFPDTPCCLQEAYKTADGRKIEGRRILVDVERGRTVETWWAGVAMRMPAQQLMGTRVQGNVVGTAARALHTCDVLACWTPRHHTPALTLLPSPGGHDA
jgi:hypothetical protein